MDALKIAFDAIIVGALALPWVVFATDLLFLKNSKDDNRVKVAWDYVRKPENVPTAAAAVMLFAVTYFLGSAISRTSEDFFNDDDLIHLWPIQENENDRIQLWPTEDNIRTAQYCDQDSQIRDTFKEITPSDFETCPQDEPKKSKGGTCNYWIGRLCDKYSKRLVRATQRVFRLQESQLLLNGEDKTERLHHLRDEIMVLRGAAFDGILGVVFCLFCWWARQGKRVRWPRVVPLVLLLVGLWSFYAHFQRSNINEAPFMELTVIVIAAAGLRGVYKGESREWYGHGLFLLMLLFLGVAYLAWWRTEVLYNDQVIYSYAQRHLLK